VTLKHNLYFTQHGPFAMANTVNKEQEKGEKNYEHKFSRSNSE